MLCVFVTFPYACPGSGVVLDCIDSLSLPITLLCIICILDYQQGKVVIEYLFFQRMHYDSMAFSCIHIMHCQFIDTTILYDEFIHPINI